MNYVMRNVDKVSTWRYPQNCQAYSHSLRGKEKMTDEIFFYKPYIGWKKSYENSFNIIS